MKKELHPTYYPKATVKCACGNKFTVGSTVETLEIEICSACHPFYTGHGKIVDKLGQVQKFKERLAKKQPASKKAATKKPTSTKASLKRGKSTPAKKTTAKKSAVAKSSGVTKPASVPTARQGK